ncbi:hypothetical protein H8S23_11450 [Anaerofilum sp. BX8]|uniref:Uncharacterized protein n=1 Tax=Anaerofilum hominis TaxID=2763016 RepID=A0A923IFQ1_9FIRM|nr:hypothetical protein [Anaerofilum hominis]
MQSAAYGIAVPQISTDPHTAVCLAELLNTRDVSPCHFRDIIQDYITALYLA